MRALRAGLIVLSLPLTMGCEGLTSWCQELVVGETVFTGQAGWFQAEPVYTIVVSTFDGGTDGIGVPTVVRIGPQKIRIATATAETLRAAGVPELTTSAAPFRLFGVRGPQSGAGLTIDLFTGTRPRMVGMSCWPGSDCDFGIGWGDEPLVTLPATQSQLAGKLPVNGVVRECVSAF
jgi:hypothetical protein